MHDNRRSNVSIENASAFAAVFSGRECFSSDNPALGASLGSPARIDFNNLDIGAFSLISKHRSDLCPRGVVYMLGQHPRCQTFDVQFFNRDSAETVDQIASELVAEIPSAGADAGVEFGERRDALAADTGATLAPGNGALTLPQALRRVLGPAGACDRLAVAQRHESGQAEVDADTIRTGAVSGFNLDMKHDVPLAGLQGEDRALGLARQRAMPADLDLARDADDADLAGLSDRQAVSDAKISGVIAGAGPKPREARLRAAFDASEERLECLVKFAQHLLLRGARPATVLRHVAPDDRQRHDLLVAFDRDALAVRFYPVLKGGIVKSTEIAKHFRQERRLRLVRLDAIFVGEDHLLALMALDVAEDRCLREVTDRASVVGPHPQRRKTRTQMQKLLPEEAGRRPLEAVDPSVERRPAAQERGADTWDTPPRDISS